MWPYCSHGGLDRGGDDSALARQDHRRPRSGTAATRSDPRSERIPLFVFDARGAFALLKQADHGRELRHPARGAPETGFGVVGGLHVYPIHRGAFAFGLGGEI